MKIKWWVPCSENRPLSSSRVSYSRPKDLIGKTIGISTTPRSSNSDGLRQRRSWT